MVEKQQIQQVLDAFADDVNIDAFLEKVYLLDKVERVSVKSKPAKPYRTKRPRSGSTNGSLNLDEKVAR